MRERFRVLVCDDNPETRVAIVRFLGFQKGLQVVGEISDVDAMLQAVAELRPDVMLVDVHMAGDGLQGLRRLRDSGHATPAVVISANPSNQEAAEALGASFFYKGVTDLRVLADNLRAAASDATHA